MLLLSEVIEGTKRCNDCRAVQPLSEFYVKVRNPDGSARTFQSYCKACARERQRVQGGIKRRGRPYEPREPAMSPEVRAARRRDRQRERMESEPDYAEEYRRRARQRSRERRRATGEVKFYDLKSDDAYSASLAHSELLSPAPF